MSKENNIDRLFRDGLSGFSETPPTHVWDSINSQLNNKRKQKMILLLWKSAAAAAFIGVIILGGLLFHSQNIEKNPSLLTSKLNITNNDSPQSNTINVKTKEHHNLSPNQREYYISKNTSLKNSSNSNNINSVSYNRSVNNKTLNQENDHTILSAENDKKTIDDSDFMTSKKAVIQTKKIDPSFIFFIENKNITDKHFADAIFNDVTPEQIQNDKRSFLQIISVGGQLSPSYSYRNTNANKANSESGITKLNGGVNINFKAAKKLHVETGLLYAQVGQKFSNTNVYVNNSMAYSMPNNQPNSSTHNNEYQNSLGNISFETSDSELMYDTYSERSTSENNSISTLKSTAKYDIDVQQELGYIEIPFILKYDIINKGIAFSLNGGFSTNLLVGNSAYSIDNNNKSKIGSMEGINTVSYSTSFGFGMRTPLTNSLDFNLEPRIKYFFNSISGKSGYSYKPYSMGLFIGVNYKF